MINLDLSGLGGFEKELNCNLTDIVTALSCHEMGGWASYPSRITGDELIRLRDTGRRIQDRSDILVLIGAGGSLLGAKALIEALGRHRALEVLYAGDNLSGEYMAALVNRVRDKNFTVIVTSKSGKTLEPAAALRVFLKLLKQRYGEGYPEHLHIVTGEVSSPLRRFAEEKSCTLFDIPENIGGRYSVLTPSGLLPAAAMDLDIGAVIEGAKIEMAEGERSWMEYAAARQALYSRGYGTEVFAAFEPSLVSFGAWWQQLFGESEGKKGRGIFPGAVSYSGDLHSMGQYIQEGPKSLFETILSFKNNPVDFAIPQNDDFDDCFDCLTNRTFNEVNAIAKTSVKAAHIEGGVPVIDIVAREKNEETLGGLMYFFMYACAISSRIMGVDPFDQPGVENYKKCMQDILEDKK